MLLYYGVVALHILVCVILVLVVLLQSGKGADLAGAFGGGATQTAFGSRGPASFLSKMTTIAAIGFMLTSVGLSLIPQAKTRAENKSVMENVKGQAPQPVKTQPAGQPNTPGLTKEQIDKKVEEESRKHKAAPVTDQQKPPVSKPAGSKPPAQ